MKNISKNIILFICNIILLTIMLAIWTDDIELTFNNYVRPLGFLKIIGVSTLGLILIRATKPFLKKKKLSPKTLLLISGIIILSTSSFLYVNYSRNIYLNRIKNISARTSLSKKIEPTNALAFGNTADNLTFQEYSEITKSNWFPKLQKEADSISYFYTYDGFLPDYELSISYTIPKTTPVDSTYLKYGNINILEFQDRKRVSYQEYLY